MDEDCSLKIELININTINFTFKLSLLPIIIIKILINENGNFEKVREIPAVLCGIEDLIYKKQ